MRAAEPTSNQLSEGGLHVAEAALLTEPPIQSHDLANCEAPMPPGSGSRAVNISVGHDPGLLDPHKISTIR